MDVLSIEVSLEVEEIGFHQGLLSIAVELWSDADVNCSCMMDAGDDGPASVHTIGRQDLALRMVNVGGREAKVASSVVTMDHRPMQAVGMTEQLGGLGNVPSGDQLADLRGRDHAALIADRLDDIDAEIHLLADLRQSSRVPLPTLP